MKNVQNRLSSLRSFANDRGPGRPSPAMVAIRKVPRWRVELIQKEYNQLYGLFVSAIRIQRDLCLTYEMKRLEVRRIVDKIEQVEFYLQTLWGFSRDPMLHTYWRQISGCTCHDTVHSLAEARTFPGIITKYKTSTINPCAVHYEGKIDETSN